MKTKGIILMALERFVMTQSNILAHPHLLTEIESMAHDLKEAKDRIKTMESRINAISTDNCDTRNIVDDLCDMYHNKIKIPHRCPLCSGDMVDATNYPCGPCDGTGIVWG